MEASLSAPLGALSATCAAAAAATDGEETAPLCEEVAQLTSCVQRLPALLRALLAASSREQRASCTRAITTHRAHLVALAQGVVSLAQDLELTRAHAVAAPTASAAARNLHTPRSARSHPHSDADAPTRSARRVHERERERGVLVAALQRKAGRGNLRKSQVREVRQLLEALRRSSDESSHEEEEATEGAYEALRAEVLRVLDLEEAPHSETGAAEDAHVEEEAETTQETRAEPPQRHRQQEPQDTGAGDGEEDEEGTQTRLVRAHTLSQAEATQRVVQCVRALFAREWAQLSAAQQTQFKRDVHRIVAEVAAAPAPRALHSLRAPADASVPEGEADESGTRARGALGVSKSSHALTAKHASAGKEKKASASVSKREKSEKRSTKHAHTAPELTQLRRLSLTSQSPRTSTVLKVQALTLQLLHDLHTFVSEHARADLRVSALLDAPSSATTSATPSPAAAATAAWERERRAALYASANQLLGLLRMTMVASRPARVAEREASAPECGTVRAVQRVEGELRKEAQGSILALDEDLAADALYLLAYKRALLASLQRRATGAVPRAVEQLLTALYAGPGDDEEAAFLVTLAYVARVGTLLREVLDDVETYTYLTLFERSTYPTKREIVKAQRKEKEKQRERGSIRGSTGASVWEEERRLRALSPEQARDKYRACTLGELVVRLTSVISVDADLRSAFFLGYRAFTTPRALWEKLCERYHVPKSESRDAAETLTIKERVAKTLLYWVHHHCADLDAALLHELRQLAEKHMLKDGLHDVARLLLAELDNVDSAFALPKPTTTPASTVPGAASEEEGPPSALMLWDWQGVAAHALLTRFDAGAVAEQLCVLSYEAYRAIAPHELVALKWSKPKHALLARNVLAYAQSVERVSFWTATRVVAPTKLKDRVKALAHAIALAKALEERRNYSALMGVLNGLSLNSVARLKLTWDALPRKTRELYDALAEYQNPSGSFKCLRDAMRQGGAGTLPYLGIYLQDLTSLDENVDFVAAPTPTPAFEQPQQPGEVSATASEDGERVQLINFAKHVLIGASIASCLQYQSAVGHSQLQRREPLYSLLLELPHLNATELYYISLEREPRQPQPTTEQ